MKDVIRVGGIIAGLWWVSLEAAAGSSFQQQSLQCPPQGRAVQFISGPHLKSVEAPSQPGMLGAHTRHKKGSRYVFPAQLSPQAFYRRLLETDPHMRQAYHRAHMMAIGHPQGFGDVHRKERQLKAFGKPNLVASAYEQQLKDVESEIPYVKDKIEDLSGNLTFFETIDFDEENQWIGDEINSLQGKLAELQEYLDYLLNEQKLLREHLNVTAGGFAQDYVDPTGETHISREELLRMRVAEDCRLETEIGGLPIWHSKLSGPYRGILTPDERVLRRRYREYVRSGQDACPLKFEEFVRKLIASGAGAY